MLAFFVRVGRVGAASLALLACGSSVSISSQKEEPVVPPEPPPPDPPPPDEPLGICGTPARDPLLVVTEGTEVAIVYGDGSRRLLDAGFGMLPDGDPRLRWMLDGERLILLAATRQLQGGIEANALISAFDAEGELLFRIAQPGVELSGVATGDDGSFIVSRYAYAGQSDYAWIRDGAAEVLPKEVTPLRGRYTGGVVRARMDGTGVFYELATKVATTAASTVGAVSTVARGDAFVSIHDDSPIRLWVERPSGAVAFDLETIDVPAGTLQPVSSSAQHLLLQHQDSAQAWRIDLVDGGNVALPLEPPDGGPPEAMSYCRPPPVVGSGGEVLMVGGTDALRFQTFTPETSAWQTLGQPIRAIETAGGFEHHGTWVVQGVVGTFCPGPVGDGDTGLAGMSTQVVRPGVGAYVLEGDVVAVLRDGGTCVGYAEFGGDVEVLDINSGKVTPLSGAGFAFWQ